MFLNVVPASISVHYTQHLVQKLEQNENKWTGLLLRFCNVCPLGHTDDTLGSI